MKNRETVQLPVVGPTPCVGFGNGQESLEVRDSGVRECPGLGD